jgi:hypothetical protein
MLPLAARERRRRADPCCRRAGTIAAALIVTTAVACTSSAPYRRLAAAGAAYAGSVEALSSAAGALAVDCSSARLLQDDALANVDLATLRRYDQEDSRRLAVLARLATHARLMRRYFTLLGDLAAGKAGSHATAALTNVATALGTAGDALRRDLGAAGAAAAARPVTTGAGLFARNLARKELDARAPVLRGELETQGEVLTSLGAAMRHDAEVLATTREQRLVVDPLLAADPVADPERWMTDRRALLGVAPALDELAAATRAARKLSAALDALAAGRVDLDRLDEVITDAEGIEAALAAVKAHPEGT